MINKSGIIIIVVLLIFINVNLSANKMISGDWYYYNDKSNGGNSKIIINNKSTLTFKFILEKVKGEYKDIALLAGTVTTDFTYGFIGMGMKLDAESAKKLHKAKGIRFKVIGDNKTYRCRLETLNIRDYDYYGYLFRAKNGVSVIEIKFNQLKQEGWGKKADFVKKAIYQISFQTFGQPHSSVFLKVFDIEIID